jgi:hypothetical protein
VARCLFPTPPPKGLVTVPACGRCNAKKSRDDTFIRDLFTAQAREHPVAKDIFDGPVTRAISRNQSELALLVKRSRVVKTPMRTPAGVIVGEAYGVPLPPGRLASILFQVGRGLYFDSRGVVFDPSVPHELLVHPSSEWNNLAGGVFRGHASKVLGDVFACSYMWATEDPFSTLWLLGFYETLVFTLSTGRTRDPRADGTLAEEDPGKNLAPSKS